MLSTEQELLLGMTTIFTGGCIKPHLLYVKLYFQVSGNPYMFFVFPSVFITVQGFQGFGFGDGGFQMSFGIGAFPFGIFATAFNINDGRPPPGTYALHTSL